MTTINRILARLDAASVTISAPDGRRVMRDLALALRAAACRDERHLRLVAQRANIRGNSNQSDMQAADIDRQMLDTPRPDIQGLIRRAEAVLAMWAGY